MFVESIFCKGKVFICFLVGDEVWVEEEVKWYVNFMVEIIYDFYNIFMFEWCNFMYFICNLVR